MHFVFTVKNAKLFSKRADRRKGESKRLDRLSYMIINDKGKILPIDALKQGGRSDNDWVNCPNNTLLASSISNMLMVMCGYRPVPNRRLFKDNINSQIVKRNEFLDSVANQARVICTSGIEGDKLIKELQVTHPSYNAPEKWSSSIDLNKSSAFMESIITWDRFLDDFDSKGLIGNISKFLSELTQIERKKLTSKPLTEVLLIAHNAIKQKPIIEKEGLWKKYFEGTGIRKAWKDLIETGSLSGDGVGGLRHIFQKMDRFQDARTLKRVERTSNRSFEIYVPYSDDLKDLLSNGPGFATILEGGFVKLGKKKPDNSGYYTVVEDVPENAVNAYVEVKNEVA